MIQPPNLGKFFELKKAEFAVFDQSVHDVILDLEILAGIARHLPENSHRKMQALYTANHMVNLLCHEKSEENLKKAHKVAAQFFSQKNGDSAFQIFATANTHIGKRP